MVLLSTSLGHSGRGTPLSLPHHPLSVRTLVRQAANAKRGKAQPPRVVGVLGCMAERLKSKLLETDGLAHLVAGPDAYRDLPRLISAVRGGAVGAEAMNVQLSADETYADIVRSSVCCLLVEL